MTAQRSLKPDDIKLLLAWMDAEASAQAELLDILVEQRNCMVRHNLDGLEALVNRSQASLRRLEAATRSRATAVGSVWRSAGLEGEPTIDAIIDAASEDDRPLLADLLHARKKSSPPRQLRSNRADRRWRELK